MEKDPKASILGLHQLGAEHQDRSIELDIAAKPDTLLKLKALASEPRLRILEYLAHHLGNLTEISQALEMNLATVTMHINILEEAGLIVCEHKPGDRGTQRVCGCLFDRLNVHVLRKRKTDIEKLLEFPIKVGSYVDFKVTPTCGLLSDTGLIGLLDDPVSFYEPERIGAELIWFHSGYLEYRVPNRLPPGAELENLSVSLELCSEAPMHRLDWPSDITLWLNGVEIGSWTSPSDFGGSRGRLTPSWHWEADSQYGLLKVWQVTHSASQVDGLKVSDVTLADIPMHENRFISLRIGVKEDAFHVGGINIFGAKFGNYPQDIILRIRYK